MADNSTMITTARKRLKTVIDAQTANRNDAILDLKMLLGGEEQWDEAARNSRNGRPILSINKLPKFLRAVTGDQRQNRPSIKVRPVDSKADPQIATIIEGHIRNIEYNSSAAYAYDNAFKIATSAGFPGYWRILTEYTDDDSFEQDIKIAPIRNPFSVYMDHSVVPYQGKEQYAFVVETITKERFKQLYPNVDTTSLAEQAKGDEESIWFDGEGIRVAEYFYLEPTTRMIYQLEDGSVVEETPKNKKAFITNGQQKVFMDANGQPLPVVKERKVKTNKVMWAKVCGGIEPLEGPQEWAGKYIPIIHVHPEEIIIEGKTHWKGLIRDARDPQRLYNYVASANIEAVALSPKAPFMVGSRQIEGHEKQWAQAHLHPYPYLIFNDENGNTTAPQRSRPVETQPGLMVTMQQANQDFEDTIGIFRAGLGAPSNEKSGIAIKERKESSDVGTYEYHDNLNRAINWSYKVLIDLIPRIYDTERGLRLMNPDDTEAFAHINKETIIDGQKVIINDITQGKYDIVATLGPAYATQRQEAQQILSEVLTSIAQVAPQAVPIIMPRLFKLMDYPEAADIAKELEAMFGKDKDQGPNPQQQAMMQLQMEKMVEDIIKVKTESIKNLALAEAAEVGHNMQEYQTELDALKLEKEWSNPQPSPGQPQPQGL